MSYFLSPALSTWGMGKRLRCDHCSGPVTRDLLDLYEIRAGLGGYWPDDTSRQVLSVQKHSSLTLR